MLIYVPKNKKKYKDVLSVEPIKCSNKTIVVSVKYVNKKVKKEKLSMTEFLNNFEIPNWVY